MLAPARRHGCGVGAIAASVAQGLTAAHTYAAAGTYTAFISSCCRIQANAPPNAHIFKSPITVTLSYCAGIDRVGVIHDCAAKNASIVCREF